MARLPAVFLSHGAPTLALQGGPAVGAWRDLAAALPRPRAILVASAHWLHPRPALGAADAPAAIHDFGGFPAALHALRYAPPGDPELAARLAARLGAELDPARGLDHGAWVPLRAMYPAADIPVLPLALQPQQGPRHHFELGRALAGLGEAGILLLASGSLTHNLADIVWGAGQAAAPDYVRAFQGWMHERLLARDLDSLLDYRRQAPGAARAHPTEEHLLPLFVALGAAWERGGVQRRYAGISEGALAMDLYVFGGEASAA
ncbi:MAG: dioxygenase [Pseudomonadota bacterium]|uniref:dioxygenase family protein n=1 Tax=Thermithiobacillus tepidarius TaxID=929 RepID=UPI0004096F83|nr:class III extradiol ring-cleavage dioxygenase [Thermithiobacillus tepidarius]